MISTESKKMVQCNNQCNDAQGLTSVDYVYCDQAGPGAGHEEHGGQQTGQQPAVSAVSGAGCQILYLCCPGNGD